MEQWESLDVDEVELQSFMRLEMANKPVPVGIARTRPRFDGESPH